MDPVSLVVASVAVTLLVIVGVAKLYTKAKQVEQKALSVVVIEALHAYEHEVVAKRQAAAAAAAEAKACEDQLTQLRAQVSGAAA